MMKRLIALLLILGSWLCIHGKVYSLDEKCGAKLAPIDESSKDPSFLNFRQRLLNALQIHDSKFILSILDPNILNDFGGASGIAAFQKKWNLSQAKSRLWSELKTILMLGGTFETGEDNQTEFVAPYVYSQWCLSMDCEDCDYTVILGKEIKLHSKPKDSAATVAVLSFDIVKIEGNSEAKKKLPSSWLEVSTLAGQRGYVPAKFVRSPTDYRAIFGKIHGEWKLKALVSGD